MSQRRIRSALLAAAFLAASLPAPAGAAKFENRLGERIVPVFQTIDLTIDPRRPGYEGVVEIDVEVREATDRFRIHAEGMTFGALWMRPADGGDGPALRPEEDTEDTVWLRADRTIRPGAYRLHIGFANAFDTTAVGLYRLDHAGDAYAFTQFESDDAREAFPSFDEPAFKIPFQVTLRTPVDDVAITNTPALRERVSGGWRHTTFARTKPLPTYLLAIAVGPFDLVDMPGLGVPGRVVTPRGQGHLAVTARDETPAILRALERYFDRPYPYAKLDLIAVPEFWPGAMEHPGAITYRDTALLLDPDTLTPSQRGLLVRWTAHELAHQWFGNFVTMEWWDDLWLNESFADWMGDRIAEEVRPALRTGERQLAGTQGTLRGDARPSSKAIRRPITSGDQLMESVGVTYQKGKLVLGMFEHWMGEGVFRRGVLDYLEANAWGNAAADDLWRALDAASGRDVSSALAGFLEQPAYPMLTVERAGAGTIRVTQQRFRAAGVDVPPLAWKVPMVVRYRDGGQTRTATLLLDEAERTFELPADGPIEWIYPNGGARGYYRWNLGARDWRALAAAARTSLEPRERIEFLGNAGALVDAGDMHADAYLATLLDFADDARPTVSSSVMAGVGRMRGSFPDEDLENAFAVYGRTLLAPLLDRLGMERREGEEEDATTLRPQVLAALGTWGEDEAVRAEAERRTAAYLEDESAVDPTLAGTWLDVAARRGDRALWDTFEERYRAATVPRERSRYLGLLGGFEDPAIREHALDYVLHEKLAPQETFTIPMAQMGLGEEEQDRVVDWVLDHYDALAARVPPPNRAFFPFLGSGCDQARWERVRAFFSIPENQVPGTTSQMRRIDDSVADCLALRAREGAALREYLRRFAAARTGDAAPR